MNELVWSREGLRARSAELWVDARRRTACSFVSHAHGDHIARHAQAIGTAPTLALLHARLRGTRTVGLPVPYGQAFTFGRLRLELLPAGHVLGSAQLRITAPDGHRTVYTGDLNTAPSLTAEPHEVAACDTLVIEATFGDPRYRFPARATLHEQMGRFAEETLAAGRTPVFLGYALGKAQEAVRILGAQGFRVRVHEHAWRLCEIYAAHGVAFPNAARLEGPPAAGEVVVAPPTLRRGRAFGPSTRTCALTGWALDAGRRAFGADVALPLSDHADFEGLVAYVRATGAREVRTMHGSADRLARELRALGIAARPLAPTPQLELSLVPPPSPATEAPAAPSEEPRPEAPTPRACARTAR